MDVVTRMKELTERLKHGKHDQSSHGRRGKRGGGGGKMSASSISQPSSPDVVKQQQQIAQRDAKLKRKGIQPSDTFEDAVSIAKEASRIIESKVRNFPMYRATTPTAITGGKNANGEYTAYAYIIGTGRQGMGGLSSSMITRITKVLARNGFRATHISDAYNDGFVVSR